MIYGNSAPFAFLFIALTLVPWVWDDLVARVRERPWIFPAWVPDRTVERTCTIVLLALIVFAYVFALVVDGVPWWLPVGAAMPFHFGWYIATAIYHRYIGK